MANIIYIYIYILKSTLSQPVTLGWLMHTMSTMPWINNSYFLQALQVCMCIKWGLSLGTNSLTSLQLAYRELSGQKRNANQHITIYDALPVPPAHCSCQPDQCLQCAGFGLHFASACPKSPQQKHLVWTLQLNKLDSQISFLEKKRKYCDSANTLHFTCMLRVRWK